MMYFIYLIAHGNAILSTYLVYLRCIPFFRLS